MQTAFFNKSNKIKRADQILAKHIFGCVLFYHAFQVKSTQIYFDTYFACIRNCWARPVGHEVYRKLYTLIGGQRAEKFENHCCRQYFL